MYFRRILLTFCAAIFSGLIGLSESRAVEKSTICAESFGRMTNPQIQIWDMQASGRTKGAATKIAAVKKTLQSATVIRAQAVQSESRTRAVILDFKGGTRGIWKPYGPDTAKEITAYKLDQILGSNLVPLTTERTHNGVRGVVQLYVQDTDGVLLLNNPRSLDLFDFLTANNDRVATNHLTHRGKTVAIDNGNAFPTTAIEEEIPDFDGLVAAQLVQFFQAGKSNAARLKAASEIAPSLIHKNVFAKLKTLTNEDWRRDLPELTEAELAGFFERKAKAVSAITSAQKALGDDIFPAGSFSSLHRDRWPGKIDMLEALSERSLPARTRARLGEAFDLIVGENLFRQEMDSAQRKHVEEILKELDAIR